MVGENWKTFSVVPRNLRLDLALDVFNPFSMLGSKYSCSSVVFVAYNLLPMLCTKKENIMLILLILGPKQPGDDIDVYLAPLVEDLHYLWSSGVKTYDALSKTPFNMRAILL